LLLLLRSIPKPTKNLSAKAMVIIKREIINRLEKDSKSFRADYNLGNALYRQKQFDAAADRYAGLAKMEKDKQKLSRCYYNMGNTMYESRKYQESVDAYKNALRNNPGDMDAKHNLQLAQRMLNNQKNQQARPKEEGKSG
jgi:Ca-activated chloride channel family protein